MEKFVTVDEASNYYRLRPRSIKIAIKKNRIKAQKFNGKWTIHINDLKQYKKNRYSKEFSTFNGKPLIDKEKGELTVTKCAELTGFKKQQIYHALRKNYLNSTRKGSAWIITLDDLKYYMLSKKKD